MKCITVAARSSPLSKAQVSEIYQDLIKTHPLVKFIPTFVMTLGDKDKQTSLRKLENTDFFTREVDALILNGDCGVGIHSAKDLPKPLVPGLKLVALTKGLDPADVLVMRPDDTIYSLPTGAKIATSSVRREELVTQFRNDFLFCDLRGTIHERLEVLTRGDADGVVVAEAALLRLGLDNLNRFRLGEDTTLNQGRLAIIARQDDDEMTKLFSCLNGL